MLQGTLVSLIHPALMDFLFLSTLWTGYLGWQWRRTRTIPEELKQLKKELPEKDAEGNRPVSKVDGRIAALEEVSSARARCRLDMFPLHVPGLHVVTDMRCLFMTSSAFVYSNASCYLRRSTRAGITTGVA